MYFITGFTKYEIDEKTRISNIGSARTFGYYKRAAEGLDLSGVWKRIGTVDEFLSVPKRL